MPGKFQQARPRLSLSLSILIVVAVIAIVYLPALNNGLVWDDHITFEQAANYRQLDFKGIFHAITQPLIYGGNYFRPLPVMSFMLQLKWFGLDTWGLHFFSLFVHILNTVMLTCLIWILLNKQGIKNKLIYATVGGLVYGLHPALIEPTIFISSRFDLLTTFFLALVLILDQARLKTVIRFPGIALLFLFAALSKEMALALPACLPFFHIAMQSNRPTNIRGIFERLREGGHIQSYLAILLGGVIYLVFRYSVLGYFLQPVVVERGDIGNALQHVLLVGMSVFEYLKLIFLPFGNLTPAHQLSLPIGNLSAQAWSGIIILLFSIGLTLRQQWRRRPNPGWYLLAIEGSLFPVLNVVLTNRPIDAFFAESFLVFPIFVTVLLVAVGWGRVKTLLQDSISETVQNIFPVIPMAWIMLGFISVFLATGTWKDDASLWGYALKKQKSVNQLVLNNYANGLILDGKYIDALRLNQKATTLFPSDPGSWHSLASTLLALDQYSAAEQAENRAIKLSPNRTQYYVALGTALQKQNQLDAAKEAYLKAYKIYPDYVPALTSLALLFEELHNYRDADRYMKRAIDLTLAGPEKQKMITWLESANSRRSQKK